MERVLAAQNPPRAMGVNAASAPPASMTSTCPSRKRRNACSIAWFAEAQAVEMVTFGPCKPKSIEIAPDAALGMNAGS